MRVLHLVKTSVGASWALRQVRELTKLGTEVHVTLPPDGPLIRQYQAAGTICHPFSLDLLAYQPWRWGEVFQRMRGLVQSVRPDLIHSHHVGTTLTVRLALGKRHPVPRIFQVPGPLHIEHPLFRFAELSTAGERDYWIGTCRKTCDLYKRSGVRPDRLFLSYYGTDIENFAGRRPGQLRRELGIDKDVRIIGMVAFIYAPKRYLGQTQGLKGHKDLIDAIALCLRTQPNLLGVFVGGAWNRAFAYERRVRNYAQKKCAKHTVFLGTRDDVPDLYPDFDVVAHPSLSENVGGAVESLLLDVPTVATNVGGLPDLVKPGETGWLVPPRDPHRLAQAILEALQDPTRSREMAIKGHALAMDLFDVRKTARQVFEIYQSVLD